MNEVEIIACLDRLGCRKIRTRGDEVWATCPNEGAHQNGVDNNPSFSVRIEEVGRSACSCFACDAANDVFEHLVTIRGIPGYEGKGPKIWKPDDWYETPPDNREIFFKQDRTPFYPPEFGLEPYKGRVHKTILNRGFTIETSKAWELGVDRESRRAIFVIRDKMGRLRGISGRATYEGQRPKYLHYSWDTKFHRFTPRKDYERPKDYEKFETKLVLYGEHMVDWSRIPEGREYIVVCEGPTDVLWLWQAGFVAVAVQGSSISIHQVSTLLELLPRNYGIMCGADSDAAGKKFAAGLRSYFAGKAPLFEPTFPEGKDPAGIIAPELPDIFKKARAVI